ncbi:hypothetical protein HH110_08775 [Stenotrophomonas sp. SAM-B]|uniref:hypothetical protein n=1 Tax=Stenotrophomonas sp. SAM-B TaxID=2729141 RepID=UPI0015A1925C|nr:hypothetical protein [Stenotrophomonas sp. SAM-B]NWF33138.1 hypothetical protein [Stenotrophomonas sp. SAM-B]
MALLYRGVSKVLDSQNGGKLLPRGTKSEVAILADGEFLADGTFFASSTVENAARLHRKISGSHGGSYVSFTTDREVALQFATNRFSESGWIYVVDDQLLSAHDVIAWVGEDAEWAEEAEVSLSTKDGKVLPAGIVVDRYEVDRKGRRLVSPEQNADLTI